MGISTPYFWHDNWVRASSGPLISGILKHRPDDFYVEESLSLDPKGIGEHLYLYVEKVNLNTEDVRKKLARHFDVPKVDVGYAGLKDRNAVCRQWFSVRIPKMALRSSAVIPDVRVLEQMVHDVKLRSHHVHNNRFRIVLRDISSLPDFREINKVPNYVGPQRFGKNGRNLQSALKWVGQNRPRTDRFRKGLYLSAMRSWIFNRVLSERVRQNSWQLQLDGELPIKGEPSGPLWGRGRLNTSGEVRRFEEDAVAQERTIADALEWSGVDQQRRSLVCNVSDWDLEQDGSNLVIRFVLDRGCFATSVLHEFMELNSLHCSSNGLQHHVNQGIE